jgi:hypothetical protein
MPSYADQTAYPKIFGKVYWGWFENSAQLEDIIIANRNQFITDFDITRCKSKSKLPGYIDDIIRPSYLDHSEVYHNENGDYVIISSPYGTPKAEEHLEKGWTEIYPIYATHARTFIKKVPLRRRLRSERR